MNFFIEVKSHLNANILERQNDFSILFDLKSRRKNGPVTAAPGRRRGAMSSLRGNDGPPGLHY
jgi:hypothetical protein